MGELLKEDGEGNGKNEKPDGNKVAFPSPCMAIGDEVDDITEGKGYSDRLDDNGSD